jgi:hypothetical protein
MWPFKKATPDPVEFSDPDFEPETKLTVVPETPNDRLIHLRIKIKSLAAEAVTIREEARKVHGMTKWELNHHRTSVVRVHSRHNLLAYGLLRGVPYEVMERKCNVTPNFITVTQHAKKFGGTVEEITAWIQAAKEYLKAYKK